MKPKIKYKNKSSKNVIKLDINLWLCSSIVYIEIYSNKRYYKERQVPHQHFRRGTYHITLSSTASERLIEQA